MWITKWEIQFFSGKAHNWILLLYLLFCVNNRHSVAIKCLNKCKWNEHQKHHHFYRYTPDTHLLTPTHLIAQLNAVGLEWQGPPPSPASHCFTDKIISFFPLSKSRCCCPTTIHLFDTKTAMKTDQEMHSKLYAKHTGEQNESNITEEGRLIF